MPFKRGFTLHCAYLLLAVSAARADVLFIDLNNGPGEIAAAQKAAARRGEKLIVYKGLKRGPNSQSHPIFTENNLAEDLNRVIGELKTKNISLSSLVISGHDGNGHFMGANGDINADELTQIFENNSPVGENVRSLYLWGCYTATPGALDQHWKKTLPNVDMVAGFDGSAPANTQKASADFLQDTLEKEKALTQLKDENEVQKALKKMKSGTQITAALCVKDKWASNKDKVDIEQRKKECTEQFLDDPKLSRFECYLRGKPECPNVPENTQSGEIRQIYNFLQSHSICDSFLRGRDRNFPSRDTTLRLIFFENVRRNFQKGSSSQLSAWERAQASIGLPPEIRISKDEIVNLSRAELLSRLRKQKEFFDQKMAGPNGNDYIPWFTYTRKLESLMTDRLRRFPASWVEPNSPDARYFPDLLEDPPRVPSAQDQEPEDGR